MCNLSFKDSGKPPRKGLRDMWNSGLYEGVDWTELDNPKVLSTAVSPPQAVISWHDAKHDHKIHLANEGPNYRVKASIHCYIDDVKFDGEREGIWKNYEHFFDIASHYDGVLGIDFSTNADFPEPLKRYQFHRMRVMEHAANFRDIATTPNARWGTSETWPYCFDGLPWGGMFSIGVVGSGLREEENRQVFESGLRELVRQKHPYSLVVIGSDRYSFFDELRERGISIHQYDGRTSTHFKGKGADDVQAS